MNVSDLLGPEFLKPVWRCGAAALVLWWAVWWRERMARGFLPLAVMAITWAACHFMVNPHSHQFPPKPEEDWLVFGAAGLLLLALAGCWRSDESGKRIPVGILSALLLAAATWFALWQLPYLLDRNETRADRHLWMAAGVAGTLVTFAATEWMARRISPGALFTGLAIFAVLAALGMWRVASPERAVARVLATASIATAGAVAAFGQRRTAAVPRGASGWFAGGVVLLVILGCLSRAELVPQVPMAAAAAAMPVAALLLTLHARLFLSGRGLAFIAAALLVGTAFFWACDQGARWIENASVPTEAIDTGADDTGAYD